ncbi:uncharacterized protein LOC136027367 [Artemia franciscana]|uniref:Uncharacterized protein n=1 Tax=Artemia franciscana TaxID=6661 RepID=A0AA88L6Z4_ARTSF|nr:hypothetical protein QYM36_013818 [Artemia franciscana]
MGTDKPYDPGGIVLILLVSFGAFFAIEVPNSATEIPVANLFRNSTILDFMLDLLIAENDNENLPFELRKLDKIVKFAKRKLDQQIVSQRFLSINRQSKLRGDLLVWLPVSFVLPTLRRRRKDKKHHHKRYAEFADDSESRLTDLQRLFNPNLTDYFFDLNLGPLLSRVDGYYGLLGVEDEQCRYLIDCYAGNLGEDLSPISDLLLTLYRTSEEFERPSTFSRPLLRFFRHYWAFKKGSSRQSFDCKTEFNECNQDVNQFINWTALKFWQELSTLLSLQLQDE